MDASSEILHELPLGRRDHENILFFSFGLCGGELLAIKWAKSRENRIRGPPEKFQMTPNLVKLSG